MTQGKRMVRRILLTRVVNAAVLACARALSLPDAQRLRLPVRGPAEAVLPDGATLRLTTSWADGNAVKVWWEGLAGYEPETLPLWWELLSEADVVLDIGANAGIYALVAALRRPGARVLAFEPLPVAVRHLEANRRLNGVDNLEIIVKAVGEEEGEAFLYVLGDYMHQIASTLPRMAEARRMGRSLTVPVVTIAQVVAEHGLPNVDLVKIDTEGTEYQVLRGARQTLRRHRPVVVCELLHGFVHEGLVPLLRSVGYESFWISPGGLVHQDELSPDPNDRERNYALLPSEAVSRVLAGPASRSTGPRSSPHGDWPVPLRRGFPCQP